MPNSSGIWNTNQKYMSRSQSLPQFSSNLPSCVANQTKTLYGGQYDYNKQNGGEIQKPIISPELLRLEFLERKIKELEQKKYQQALNMNNFMANQYMNNAPLRPIPQPNQNAFGLGQNNYYVNQPIDPALLIDYMGRENRRRAIREEMNKIKMKIHKNDDDNLRKTFRSTGSSIFTQEGKDFDKYYEKRRKKEIANRIFDDDSADEKEALKRKNKEFEEKMNKKIDEMQKKQVKQMDDIVKELQKNDKNEHMNEMNTYKKLDDFIVQLNNLPTLIEQKILENESLKQRERRKEDELQSRIEKQMNDKFNQLLKVIDSKVGNNSSYPIMLQKEENSYNNPRPHSNINVYHDPIYPNMKLNQISPISPVTVEPKKDERETIDYLIRERMKEEQIRKDIEIETKNKQKRLEELIEKEKIIRELEKQRRIIEARKRRELENRERQLGIDNQLQNRFMNNFNNYMNDKTPSYKYVFNNEGEISDDANIKDTGPIIHSMNYKVVQDGDNPISSFNNITPSYSGQGVKKKSKNFNLLIPSIPKDLTLERTTSKISGNDSQDYGRNNVELLGNNNSVDSANKPSNSQPKKPKAKKKKTKKIEQGDGYEGSNEENMINTNKKKKKSKAKKINNDNAINEDGYDGSGSASGGGGGEEANLPTNQLGSGANYNANQRNSDDAGDESGGL